MDSRTWWAAVHGVTKSRTRLSEFRFTFHFNTLEKEMATHSSILGLENPMDRGTWRAIVQGVTRVRHDLGTKPPPKTPTFHGDEWMGGELLFQNYSKQMREISNQVREHSIYST